MAVNRLTYFFLSFYEEVIVNTNIGSTQALLFTSDFPFTFDEELALPRPIRSTDISRDENGNPIVDENGNIELSVSVYSYGNYNQNNWFIGIGVNNKEIWDGIARPVTDSATGLELVFQSSTISVINYGFLPNGKGYVTLAKDLTSFGLLDTVEIVIKNAKTKTPWIYYGNIPQRQEIAFEQFGRNPGGMGGVPESITPAQAMGYDYYVDFLASSQSNNLLPSFPIGTFFTGESTSSSFSKRFFMGDILDGDGRVAVRSNVDFQIFSVGQNASFSGFDAPVFSIINTGAFKTINYKELEYSSTTYDINKVVKNTRYYLAFQSSSKFKNIYYNISETVRVLLGDSIDFDTTIFSIFSFNGSSANTRELDISEKESFVQAIKNIELNDNELEANLGSLLNLVKGKVATDAQRDLQDNIEYSYCFVVFGDMVFSDTQSQISGQVVEVSSSSINLRTYGTHLLLDEEEDRELGSSIFGNNISLIYGFKNSSIYGFQFIETLVNSTGITLTENDLYKQFDFFNAPVVISQTKRIIEPLVGDADNPIDLVDRDNDGKLTYVDRIYELYNNFNPAIDIGEESFFGSRGVEMRYWRKMCPIGQIYSFYGEILSTIRVRAFSYLLSVKVVRENPDYIPGVQGPRFIDTDIENNIIQVYYETGAQSNISNSGSSGVFSFRGRLFHPQYWISNGTGIQLASGVNLNNPETLASWYRILPDTARDLLDNIIPNEEPVVIIRTNVVGGADPIIADGQGFIPNLFIPPSDASAFYKISQLAERVEDHIVKVPEDDLSDEYNITPVGNSRVLFQSVSDLSKIMFQTLEFEIDLPEKTDVYGLYEYEIYWQNTGSSEEHNLKKFWSGIAFEGGAQSFYPDGIATKVKMYLNTVLTFIAVQSYESPSDEFKIFDIVFPYRRTQNYSSGVRHFFTWHEVDYSFTVYINGTRISSAINASLDEVDASLDNLTGRLTLKQSITATDIVTVEFRNITGNQGLQKIGTTLGIRLVGSAQAGETEVPVIRNVKINQITTLTSVERVDGNYYNPGGVVANQDHFMAPAFGFAVLSGRNWDLALDDRNSTAGGAGNIRVTGVLTSPIWYFDAFETDLGKKLVSEESSKYLVAIDRIFSNMVSTFTQPFVEVLSIGFTPPQPDIIPKVTSIYNELMKKFIIAYNIDSNIGIKYSHTGFISRNSEFGNFNKRNRNQRYEIIAYTGKEREEVLADSNVLGGDIVFNTASSEDPNSILVGLKIGVGPVEGKQSDVQNVGIYELYANISSSMVPFGYQQFNGQRTGLLVGGVYDDREKRGSVQLPLTTDINIMELRQFEVAEYAAPLEFVNGIYVDTLVEGRSPTLYISPFGTYLLFFSQQENGLDLITGLISREQANRWSRPATYEGDDDAYTPVPILTGYINPQIIQEEGSGMVHLFLYNNVESSIVLLSIPYVAFEKFSVGITEDDEEYSSESEVEEGQQPLAFSDLIRSLEEHSWKKVFSEGRSLYSVVFEATQNYSAAIAPTGGIYLASLSYNSELRLLYSPATSAGELIPSAWRSLRINILHPNGHLSKVLDASEIYAITLTANKGDGSLSLFISTTTLRLILFKIPTALTSKAAEVLDSEESVIEKMQEDVNEVIPILVVGNNVEESENLNTEGNIDEEFPTQLPSVQWRETNEVYIVYYKDSKIKGIKSTTSGSAWRDFPEI